MSDIFEEIKKQCSISEDIEKRIVEEYGSRGKKALEAYKNNKVKKYRDFFVVEGSRDSYIVEEDFCTCNDYLYRLSSRGGICYHSLAAKIARAAGKYESIDRWYSDIADQKPAM